MNEVHITLIKMLHLEPVQTHTICRGALKFAAQISPLLNKRINKFFKLNWIKWKYCIIKKFYAILLKHRIQHFCIFWKVTKSNNVKVQYIKLFDSALLCSYRAGSDLGHESGLVWGVIPSGDSNPGLWVSVYLNLTHALKHSATTAGC